MDVDVDGDGAGKAMLSARDKGDAEGEITEAEEIVAEVWGDFWDMDASA